MSTLREPGQAIRFLLCDDEPDMLEYLHDHLCFGLSPFGKGHEIRTCRNRDEFERTLPEFQAQILIADLYFLQDEGFTGIDLLEVAQRHYPDALRIIFTSQSLHLSDTELLRLWQQNPHGIIHKTDGLRLMCERVWQIWSSGQTWHEPLLMNRIRTLTQSQLPAPEVLTQREQDVLVCKVQGLSLSQISRQLSISPSSADTYWRRTHNKLGIKQLEPLRQYCIQHSLLG